MRKRKGTVVHDESEQRIENLAFYRDSYMKSARQTLSYTIPALCVEVEGVVADMTAAMLAIERAEKKVTKKISELTAATSRTRANVSTPARVAPLSPEAELAATVARQKEGK